MKLRKFGLVVLSSTVLELVIVSCNHYTTPTAVWNPNQQYATAGTIALVLPSNSAIAGVREITIIGKNFSKNIDSDWVWYDADSAIVKSYSLTGPIDTIVVYRPANFGFNLYLKVVVPGADSIGMYKYTIEQPVKSTDLSASITGTSFVMTSGGGNNAGDTMWIATTGYVYEVLPGGAPPIAFKDTSYLKPKIGGVATDFGSPLMDMKMGPGGVLYATFNNPKTSNIIYRLDPDSSLPTAFATIASPTKSVGYFDFDDNGNIYTGNSKGLYLVKQDGTYSSIGDYSSFTFFGVRVIKDASGDKFVYAANAHGLFRSPINSDGTVGSQQQVYNITADTSKLVAGSSITSFGVASDGTVLISLSGTASYSLFELENGTLTPYYHETTILPSGIKQLIWGNSRWLYLNTGGTTLYQMGVATESGTPLMGAPNLGL